MPIITIASQKGGSGKTTLATCLAEALTLAGERVLLADADPQRSALTWAGLDDRAPAALGADVATLRPDRLRDLSMSFRWVIIDSPPRIDATTIAALSVADLVLVPTRPTPLDMMALPAIVRAIEQAGSPPARGVITQRASRSSAADTAPDALRASGLAPLAASLGFRSDYALAFGYGLGVLRYTPRSKAADELRALLTEIRTLLTPKVST